jgi:hypothetical protein
MGFNFKELAVTAMVGKNADPNEFVQDSSQNATAAHLDEEKRVHSGTADSEEELTKVDTTAPDGVQRIQAMTYVWSKPNLIAAYVL